MQYVNVKEKKSDTRFDLKKWQYHCNMENINEKQKK